MGPCQQCPSGLLLSPLWKLSKTFFSNMLQNATTRKGNKVKNSGILWRSLANIINFFLFHNVCK